MIRRMPPLLTIHFLPTTVKSARLAGTVAVMIDVLRASTTVTHALAAGCDSIRPCRDVVEARQLAARTPACPDNLGPLLAGERGGTRIDGFDLGNSPSHFTTTAVGGRTIIFTTTNGTSALEHCRPADMVLVAAFCNIRAVTDTLVQRNQPVHLVCAGTDGEITAEDCLCAGAIGLELQAHGGFDTHSHDATRIAISRYQQLAHDSDQLLAELRDSHGGRNLQKLGFDDDSAFACRHDTIDLVPAFDTHSSTIRTLS